MNAWYLSSELIHVNNEPTPFVMVTYPMCTFESFLFHAVVFHYNSRMRMKYTSTDVLLWSLTFQWPVQSMGGEVITT